MANPPLNFAQVAFSDQRPTCVEIAVSAIDTNCMGCLPQPLAANASSCFIGVTYLTSRFTVNYVVNGIGGSYFFGDQGVYEVVVGADGTPSVLELHEPVNDAVPLIVALFSLLALNFIIRGLYWIRDKFEGSRRQRLPPESSQRLVEEVSLQQLGKLSPPQDEGQQLVSRQSAAAVQIAETGAVVARGKVRYVCLDTLRGISLSVMIFVNYGGGGYWYLDHSAWNGLTVADLVFPWFIFMMGASAAVVLSSAAKRGTPKSTVMINALRRSVTLCCYGLLIAAGNRDGSTQFSTLRIPGVLQRFGVSYLAVVAIMYCLPPGEASPVALGDETSTTDNEASNDGMPRRVLHSIKCGIREDFTPYRFQWAIVVTLALIWILVTFSFAFPGCPAGYIGPGGISDEGKYANCTGGIAAYIDYKFFGENHIYQDGTFVGPYETTTFHDPEGLLGVLNSIVLCYAGAVAGRVLLRTSSATPARTIARLAIYGSLLCFAAACLCGFTQNSGPIPVNKNLWSTSFVLLLSGFAMWLLAVLYLVVDVKKYWDGKPFVFLGLNSILVYMFSEMLASQSTLYVNDVTHAWLLFRNILSVSIWTTFAFWLHCHRWYFAI